MTFLGKERWGVIGLGSSACKIPSRFPSESAFELHLPRQTPDPSDLRRRRLGSAELALAGSVPAGGGLDRRWVKVPGSTPGKIPKPCSDLGKNTKSVVRNDAEPSELMAVRRIVTATNCKADEVQHKLGNFQKQVNGLQEGMNRVEALLQRLVNLQAQTLDQTVGRSASNVRQPEDPRKLPEMVHSGDLEIPEVKDYQPRKAPGKEILEQEVPDLELEMARSVEDLRQINLNSTQGIQLMSTPEGNFNFPSTGLSVVVTGWGEDPLPHSSLASSTWNHQNPSHEPALVRQWPQNPKEYLSQPHSQYQVKQWNPNSGEEKVLSALTVNVVKAKSCTGDGHNVDRKLRQKLDMTEDEAHFHMKQGAFLYNFDAQTLPKSYHCFSRRLMLEYSKFSSLDSDEPFACKLNNPKHRNTYKQVYVHVLNYEAILWEKLPKFSMQQLYFVGLLWNLPPWPDLSFCEVYWMAMGMEKGARAVSRRNAYNIVAGQSKNQFQPTRNKQLTDDTVLKKETALKPFIPVNFNLYWSLIVICYPGEVETFEDGAPESVCAIWGTQQLSTSICLNDSEEKLGMAS